MVASMSYLTLTHRVDLAIKAMNNAKSQAELASAWDRGEVLRADMKEIYDIVSGDCLAWQLSKKLLTRFYERCSELEGTEDAATTELRR